MIFYDISQSLSEETAVWPGDEKYCHRWTLRMRGGDSSNVSAVSMSVHAGTHIDAPLHVDDAGCDVASVWIGHAMGPARVFSIFAVECIKAADLETLDWQSVERVLFKTRAAGFPSDTLDRNSVYFDESAAEFLVKKGIILVGTDAPSVDAFDSHDLRVHKILLQNGALILEGARLDTVPPGDYQLVCLPLKLAGMEASPVRAVLWKE